MLKLKLLTTLCALLLVTDVFSSHYMGGEITWQCLPNGRFRFVMKLYRECNGVTFGATETINVFNCPSLTAIAMNLYPGGNPYDTTDGTLDGKTDISPNCWSSTEEIHCSPSPSVTNTGAIEEWYYTSDVAYPTGIMITGVPPASGWIFSHASCCRNPTTNIVGATSDSWFLRAVMYEYNGQNGFPCFDNSPDFAEIPAPVSCIGGDNTYNYNANDRDLDSLYYDWAPALNGSLTVPVTYSAGYTYNAPLPGSSQMNYGNGEISYAATTSGAFITVVKVSSYRCGVKIAEVFREMQNVILACPVANNYPDVTPPFYDSIAGVFNLYVDTVYAGEVVNFDITAIDMDILPSGNPNTIYLEASSPDFGTGYTSTISGCLNPPCATLNPAPPMSAMVALATHFQWQTDCDHINFIQNCGTMGYVHNFYFKINDNACPASATKGITVTIVVLAPPILPSPSITDVDVMPNGNVALSWTIPSDPQLSFAAYYIYTSGSPSGPFTLLDSVLNHSQTTYTHLVTDGLTTPHYYYMETRSGCYGDFYSNPSDTAVYWLFNDIPPIPNEQDIQLSWDQVNSSLNILLQQEAEVNIELFSITGQALMQERRTGKQFSLDLQRFSKGLYLVKIRSLGNGSIVVKKLTIN